MKQLLTPSQVSEILNVSTDHARKLMGTGKIKSVDVGAAGKGRTWRTTQAAIEDFLANVLIKTETDQPRRRVVPPPKPKRNHLNLVDGGHS